MTLCITVRNYSITRGFFARKIVGNNYSHGHDDRKLRKEVLNSGASIDEDFQAYICRETIV